MVVAVRLTKETAEMMRSQKRKAAAAAAARAAAAAATASTTNPASSTAGGVGTGTPPLASSPGRRPPSSGSLSKPSSPSRSRPTLPTRANYHQQYHHHQQQQYQQAGEHPHQTRQKSRKQDTSSQSLGGNKPQVIRLPAQSKTLSSSHTTSHASLPPPRSLPTPISVRHPPPQQHSHQQHQQLPNPSFGEEDYRMLEGCIENMGSMGSIESVADLVDGIDRQDDVAAAATGGSGGMSRRSSSYYMSSEKVEAASRAAAAVLAGENGAMAAAGRSEAHAASSTAAASRLLESTARDIMGTGSNESIVISSPSGHSQEHSSSLSHPHSPESFLLDDSLLDPKTNFSRSYDLSQSHSFAITPGTTHQDDSNIQAYNPSPTSLDWEYTNMDHFFEDMGATTGSVSGGGNGREGSRSPVKRKSTDLGNISFASDSKDQHDESKRSRLSLYGNDSFSHFANAPIASFGVFGSLSNSSTDLADKHGTTLPKKSQVKTIALSPRNRLSSLPRSGLPPMAPQLSGEEQEQVVAISNEHSHPSKGTLEHYDPALYQRLKETEPPRDARHPPLLVPSDRTGSRLAVVRGSLQQHTEYEVNDCASSKTYEFYKFLREIYPALEGCTYLLPGLQRKRIWRRSSSLEEDDAVVSINVSSFGSFRLGHVPGMTRSEKFKLTKSDSTIARQRVECAIYAFGGTVKRNKQPQTQPIKPDKMSIFRTRKGASPSGSTPSSSGKSSAQGNCGSGKKRSRQPIARSNSSVRRERYEKRLRSQYFEHGNRLSWDVQANLSLSLSGARTFDDDDSTLKRSGSNLSDGKSQRKNRCKKCGQIKQGHTCPYASSLQRNIGVMVYPSANAHVADEPGTLAPALCEMNNFISFKSSTGSFGESGSSEKKGVGNTDSTQNKDGFPKQVGSAGDSPASSPFRRKTLMGAPTITCKPIDDKRSDTEDGRDEKNEDESEDLLFQPKMEVTLDQFRSVTPKDPSTTKRDYTYPQVPLTFSQRKSMSDSLFSLSKLVPKLTDECALVLTEARKRDQWDLAVAELMTQVICVLHCSPSKDYTLEGLRRYLLALGIVC